MGSGGNLKWPWLSVRVNDTNVESINLTAITIALDKGPLTAVSCTLPDTFNFWEKEEILINKKR